MSFLTAVITNNISRKTVHHDLERHDGVHIVHLWKQRHKSKFVIFQEKLLKVLKCCTFLWVQRQHNCSPEASFTNCVMTLYLLKVHLQTFLFIPIIQKCQILSCDTLVANERYVRHRPTVGKKKLWGKRRRNMQTGFHCWRLHWIRGYIMADITVYLRIYCIIAYEECVKIPTGKLIYLKISWHQIRSTHFLDQSNDWSQFTLPRHAVVKLVEALRYRPEGRGFDFRLCHWNFLLT